MRLCSFILILWGSFYLAGCTKPSESTAKIRLNIKLAKNKRWTNFEGIDCVGVNIMGAGVGAVASAPNASSMAAILSGSTCTYPGVLSDSVAVPPGSSDPVTLSVRGPTGRDRIVQLFGISNGGAACPTAAALSSTWTAEYGLYELGRARTDLLSDASLSITADYDESTYAEIRCGTVPPSAFCAVPANQSGNYAGGTNTAIDPLEFCSLSQLVIFSATPAAWASGNYYELRSDIDDSAGTLAPIGNNTTQFNATFSGNGHTVVYTRNALGQDYYGFFGALGTSATVSNLHVNGALSNGGQHIGLLVGAAGSGSTISSCTSQGAVSGATNVGGLVGSNYSTITSCSSSALVTCTINNCGGFVGSHLGGVISLSKATGNVTGGTARTGGFAGEIEGSTAVVNTSGATGSVTSSGTDTGGFAGKIGTPSALAQECYATGAVSGVTTVGGFVGTVSTSNGVDDSYSTGAVTGTSPVGGFVGDVAAGTLNRVYTSTASVTGTVVGSFGGNNSTGTYNNCFSDSSVSNSGTGFSFPTAAAALLVQSTFDPPWNFTTIWTIRSGETPSLRNAP